MRDYFLSDSYLLKGATIGDIESIEVVCETREFQTEQIIVAEGEVSHDMFIVLEGAIRAQSNDGTIVGQFGPGAVVGEIAFLDGKPRATNIIANGASKLLVIPAERLKTIMTEKPHLAIILYRNMALALCARVRSANAAIESLREEL